MTVNMKENEKKRLHLVQVTASHGQGSGRSRGGPMGSGYFKVVLS